MFLDRPAPPPSPLCVPFHSAFQFQGWDISPSPLPCSRYLLAPLLPPSRSCYPSVASVRRPPPRNRHAGCAGSPNRKTRAARGVGRRRGCILSFPECASLSLSVLSPSPWQPSSRPFLPPCNPPPHSALPYLRLLRYYTYPVTFLGYLLPILCRIARSRPWCSALLLVFLA